MIYQYYLHLSDVHIYGPDYIIFKYDFLINGRLTFEHNDYYCLIFLEKTDAFQFE